MSTTFNVTLKALRQAGACYSGYNKVVRALQAKDFTLEDQDRKSYIRYAHNDNISLKFILESNGLEDTIWALRCVDNVERDTRLYAVWCARQVQSIMTDSRSITALDVAERYANGQATKVELTAASDAAWTAAWAAASDAASDAAWAAQKEMFVLMINGAAPWQQ